MRDRDDCWNATVVDVITRVELRLEQYRIHAASLDRASRTREGVDEIIRRLEERLAGLRSHHMAALGEVLRTVGGDRRDQGVSRRGT
jgi:hypothetical protein